MSKPTILTVDDDAQVSAAIARDLTQRYGGDYQVVRTTSGAQALSVLARAAPPGQPGADLRAADRRPPLVRAQPRPEDLPGPQPRALRLVRRGARRRGTPAARPRRGRAGR